MYKVLIVEDEELIRKGLVYSIPWADMDCTIVATGANGQEGMALIAQHRPDIVLTDINMPIISGLEMLAQTVTQYHYVPIVLSGYSTFEYAQAAIRCGTARYLLKPLDRKELSEAIAYATQQCDLKKQWSSEQLQQLPTIPSAFAVLKQEYTDPVVQEMLRYIKEHFSEKITLDDIVKELNYSISFLNKRFKQETHTTFIDYLNRYRLQKSMDMMQSGTMTFQEIAWHCGFADYKYFSNTFKRQLGFSPKKYAKQVGTYINCGGKT